MLYICIYWYKLQRLRFWQGYKYLPRLLCVFVGKLIKYLTAKNPVFYLLPPLSPALWELRNQLARINMLYGRWWNHRWRWRRVKNDMGSNSSGEIRDCWIGQVRSFSFLDGRSFAETKKLLSAPKKWCNVNTKIHRPWWIWEKYDFLFIFRSCLKKFKGYVIWICWDWWGFNELLLLWS